MDSIRFPIPEYFAVALKGSYKCVIIIVIIMPQYEVRQWLILKTCDVNVKRVCENVI